MVLIHCDAAVSKKSEASSGPGASVAVLFKNGQPVLSRVEQFANITIGVAEYAAVLKALAWMKETADIEYSPLNKHKNEDDTITIRTDSEFVVKQLNGIYTVRDEKIKPLYHECIQIAHELKSRGFKVVFEWMPRKENMANDIAQYAVPKA